MMSFVSETFVFPIVPAFIITCAFQMSATIAAIYYSLGITLRYIFLRKQSMELRENWTDNDVQIAARTFAISIGILFMALHLAVGGLPRFYSELTGQVDTVGQDRLAVIIPVSLLSIAIILNVTFRILIHIQKKQAIQSLGSAELSQRADMKSAVAIFVFICFLTLFLLAIGLTQDDPSALKTLRYGSAILNNGIPLLVMLSSSEFVTFLWSKFKTLLQALATLAYKGNCHLTTKVNPLPY